MAEGMAAWTGIGWILDFFQSWMYSVVMDTLCLRDRTVDGD